MNFSHFSFDRRIDAGIQQCGYNTPTPIQHKAIPLALSGRDVMGLAQTGTGKTAAFVLPILQKILTSASSKQGPRALVLAPTRELAIQINKGFKSLGQQTGIVSSIVIGGVGMQPQIKAFRTSDVIVACPGRLVRLIARGAVAFKGVETLVLDEADRMLDMGFLPDIKKVLTQLPAKRQNLLFSATMPKSILALTKRILVNPEIVQIEKTSPVTNVAHVFYETQAQRKNELLGEILSRAEHRSILIFTRTKYKAKNLARKLGNSGYDATFLQGNMSQGQRERALNGFRDGRYSILVATDIVARGIDCERITLVVNYDMPHSLETYTHRIGRTGRAGRSGLAISFVTSEDAAQLRAIQKVIDVSIERDSHYGNEASRSNSTQERKKSSALAQKKARRRRKTKSSRNLRTAA